MGIKITPRLTRNKKKIHYSLAWGKSAGQRIATGVFSYVDPADSIQRHHNKEALRLLKVKKNRLTLDQQAIGTGILPRYRFKANFLDFYKEYVHDNKQTGNRHLEGSYTQFKVFLLKTYLPPIEVTEALSTRFRKYLLDKFNGDTPANYFSRFKRVVKAASKEGYFTHNPVQDVAAMSNKNRKRKEHLEAGEYLILLKAPCTNDEVWEAFILCCYTGMRWCDVKTLNWKQIKEDAITFTITQHKTKVENRVTLHPVAKAILDSRRSRLNPETKEGYVFQLPSQDGALKCLDSWCRRAGIEKHITWNCARLSFSILLQDANVDAATVALLLGQASTKYILETYKRFQPKDQAEVIAKLPTHSK